MKPILMIMGSDRDQARLIPLYKTCESQRVPLFLCTASSGAQLTGPLFNYFAMKADQAITCSSSDQALMTAEIMRSMAVFMADEKPSHLVVAGQSALVVAATLSAHYQGVPVVHVPVMASSPQQIQDNSLYNYNVQRFVDYHCVPTQAAAAQLLAQGVHRNAIHVCGSLQADLINTLVDAIQSLQISVSQEVEDLCAFARIQHQKIVAVVVDAYQSSESLFAMLEAVMQKHKDVMIIVMVASKQEYSYVFDYEHDRYKVCVAPSYYDRLLLLSKAQVVITNMHDVHEDALCLARPVILLQPYSHYPETVWAGYTHVVNNNVAATQATLEKLILQQPTYDLKKMFGNGTAAAEIIRFLQPRMV